MFLMGNRYVGRTPGGSGPVGGPRSAPNTASMSRMVGLGMGADPRALHSQHVCLYAIRAKSTFYVSMTCPFACVRNSHAEALIRSQRDTGANETHKLRFPYTGTLGHLLLRDESRNFCVQVCFPGSGARHATYRTPPGIAR